MAAPTGARKAGRMPEFVRVARLSEMPAGSAKTVTAGDYEIVLFNVAGRLYALEDAVPASGRAARRRLARRRHVHRYVFLARLVLRPAQRQPELGDGFEGVPSFEVRVEGGRCLRRDCLPSGAEYRPGGPTG